ncbi:MAG: hypothetical protein HY764_01100 [Candidatus Portnoybacteria bacterium]|nr:hypothetical protein [Candidatus Portnoybacteria bacterium]
MYPNHSYIIKKIITVVYDKKGTRKNLAIRYRKRGLSYSEILKLLPVAKSTLSVWLKDVSLAKKQKQRLTEKRRQAQFKAQQTCREKRIKITEEIKAAAKREIRAISKRDLWLIGVALYWAEGSKEHQRGTRVQFGNSDPRMIKIFLGWLQKCCQVLPSDITFSIYLHETAVKREREIQKYWSKITDFPISRFKQIVWKKNKINTKRKNVGENYCGLLRITIAKSTNLNRKIAGWIEGIYKNCGVV